jgi:recombination protein RecA
MAALHSELQSVHELLRTRRLDRTLTSVAPVTPPSVAPLASAEVTQVLAGGVPRGQVSEIVGPASSGRTSLAWAALAAATARGEWVSLVDTFDRFDPEWGAGAGIELSQLLWVRGQALSKTASAVDPAWVPGVRGVSGPGTLLERTVDRAIKALNLIVQSGVCTLVVLDLIDAPAQGLARIPRSTWLRIQRVIEGSDITVLLLAAAPLARSAGGVSITTGGTIAPGGAITTGVGSRESGVGRALATGVAIATGGESTAGVGSRGATGETRPESVLPVSRERPYSRQITADSQLPTPDSRHDRSRARWKGTHDRSRRLGGLATGLRATSPRGVVGELPFLAGC